MGPSTLSLTLEILTELFRNKMQVEKQVNYRVKPPSFVNDEYTLRRPFLIT